MTSPGRKKIKLRKWRSRNPEKARAWDRRMSHKVHVMINKHLDSLAWDIEPIIVRIKSKLLANVPQ
jgi:hypothetical protein